MAKHLLSILFCTLAAATAWAQVSPHGPIKFDCQTCHATDSWEMRRDADFDHASTGFPLAGQHRSVDCASCHAGLKFASQNTNCLSCHTDIHKSELGENCTRCHTTQSWRVPDMLQKHQQARFPLVGRHTTLECQSCHANASTHQYVGTPTTCVGCHRNDFQATKNPNHVAAGFSSECAKCHRVTAFTWGQGFDHDLTAFPLGGAHKSTPCIACHQNGRFKGTPTECSACHRAEFTTTTNPNHAAAGFSMQCQTCHSPAAWMGARYDHNALTRFPLTGSHTVVQCSGCHGDNVFAGRPVDCFSCHQNAFVSAQSPNHVAGNFNHDCTQCHSTANWNNATFDHNVTRFPLTGGHTATQCQSCHINGNYQLTYNSCYQCHQTQFQRTTNPNHVTGNFDHNCTQCHSTTNWNTATFNHSTTLFPLTGAHIATTCQSCHVNGNYQLHYTECYQCHQTQFQQTTNPNHVTGNFSHNCSECHSTTNWDNATFNHNTTLFPLTGAHTATACQSCHVNGNYQLHYNDCYQCHQAQFQQTTNPNHVTGNFSHDCSQCHSTINWSGATFNHATTRFPLTGAHATEQCQSCHVNGNYQLVYTNCYPCHQAEFAQPTNPNHVLGNFNHDCSPCHTTMLWRLSTFSHSSTRFPLTGAHQAASCIDCHVNNQYQNLPMACWDCHAADFNGSINPNHVTGNFNHDCMQCHTTTGWSPASFNHNVTLFPLTGAHIAAQCQSCHVNGNYQLHYTDCYQCHQAQYQQTTNPNHVVGNFSHDCSRCHSTINWSGATFDHNTTLFPLTGAHTTTTCQSCHVNGNYQLHFTDCYQCHQTQFALPTNPNHVLGNFGHDCRPCHTTSVWRPSTFNHNNTQFPLTGAHQAATCNSCHVNNQYQNLPHACWDCHAADFNGTTNPNHVTGQFNHDCTQCHSTVGWSPATFNHNATLFPLTGAHTTTACQSCHINGNYQLHFTDCYQCHQTQFALPTNPNHVLGNFGHDCRPCHTTSVWRPSTFSHNNTQFPLTGAHQAVACNSCHVNNQYQNLPHACWDCHAADFNGTTNPNHVTGQFNHDCTQCHGTSGWSPATFNHGTTAFPLTGAHTSTSCQSCHVNGNYQLHYTDCYQCHQSDFQGVSNPNHVTQLFNHTCAPCHSTSVWTPNTMNHDANWFRIYSGKHRNKWTQCSQCHIVPGNLTSFNCATACHQNAHNQGQSCYGCHRNV